MNNTKIDDYKSALYRIKNTFSKQDERAWSSIETINDCIDKLLNDEKMMCTKNKYTFAERTLANRCRLLSSLCEILVEGEGKEDGYFEQAKIIFDAIRGCSFELRPTSITENEA